MNTITKISLAFTIAITVFACDNQSSDTEYPFESNEFVFVDTLGKTYFVVRRYYDPGMVSDDEINEYLTFEIDSSEKSFHHKDSSLRKVSCMTYTTQFELPVLDTTYAYIRKGQLSGKKINSDEWQISVDLETPRTHNKIVIENSFLRSKKKLVKMKDGRIDRFWQ